MNVKSEDQAFGDLLLRLAEPRLGPRFGQRLARELGVDRSLVGRWLRNDRVPSLSSDYVSRLVQILGLSSTEAEALRTAQIIGLEVPQKVRRRHKAAAGVEYARSLLSVQPRVARPPALPEAPPIELQPLYTGHGAFIRAFATAVERLPRAAEASERTVLVCVVRRPTIDSVGAELAARWQQALVRLLQRGWNFTFLAVEDDAADSRELLRRLLQFANSGPGDFRSAVLPPGGAAPGLQDLAVFPDAAIVGLPTDRPGVSDLAAVHRHPAHVAAFRRHFDFLLRQAKPTVSLYRPYDLQLLERIAAIEQLPGDRLLVKDGFSAVTMPTEWLNPVRLRQGAELMPGPDFDEVLSLDQQRQARRAAILQLHEWRDVSSQAAVQQLATTGRFRNADIVQELTLSPVERIAFLEQLAEQLERYPKYHLALAGPREQHVFIPAAWMVHGDQAVILRRAAPQGDFNTVVAETKSAARAFRQYFLEEVWNALDPRHRQRAWVIAFLRQTASQIG